MSVRWSVLYRHGAFLFVTLGLGLCLGGCDSSSKKEEERKQAREAKRQQEEEAKREKWRQEDLEKKKREEEREAKKAEEKRLQELARAEARRQANEAREKEEAETQRLKELVKELSQLRSQGVGLPPKNLRGTAVIWNMTRNERCASSNGRLPAKFSGTGSDPNLFLFVIVEEKDIKVCEYKRVSTRKGFDGKPVEEVTYPVGYRREFKIQVFSVAERKLIGIYTVAGKDPPENYQSNNSYQSLVTPLSTQVALQNDYFIYGEWDKPLAASVIERFAPPENATK